VRGGFDAYLGPGLSQLLTTQAADLAGDALGLAPGEDLGDLAPAAAAVNAAHATRLDGGGLIRLAARLAAQVRTKPTV
jgi:hypothetical protein